MKLRVSIKLQNQFYGKNDFPTSGRKIFQILENKLETFQFSKNWKKQMNETHVCNCPYCISLTGKVWIVGENSPSIKKSI